MYDDLKIYDSGEFCFSTYKDCLLQNCYNFVIMICCQGLILQTLLMFCPSSSKHHKIHPFIMSESIDAGMLKYISVHLAYYNCTVTCVILGSPLSLFMMMMTIGLILSVVQCIKNIIYIFFTDLEQ